jgi:ubiquinone/menaquinone biosynthesis C-methylase UbiE
MFEAERHSRTYYEGRARLYDWANRVAGLMRGVSPMKERRKAVDKLALKRGDRVLEVSVGTGTNAPLITEQLKSPGAFVGLDISRAMLGRCDDKLRRLGARADLVEAEAAHLPFAAAAFDAVFHHGGFAEFGDKQGAIDEMVRVARPSAKVVICDAGLPQDRKLPFMSRLLLRMQPEYAHGPPVSLLPSDAVDLQVSWFHGGAWYLIEFSKPVVGNVAAASPSPRSQSNQA